MYGRNLSYILRLYDIPIHCFMKKILLFTLIACSFQSFSQITIDESLTAEELIETIFLDNTVTDVSNIIQSTGTDFNDVNGIAAFTSDGTDFLSSGIILSTGGAAFAPGPNLDIQNNGSNGWPGDADLEAFTGITDTNNASFIQFDFTSFVNQASFNVVLAAEEYDQNFECTFEDAFALIITDNETGQSENIAYIPGTEDFISVTNIHPEVTGQCDAINEEFFDRYNFEPFNSQMDAALNFNGQTVAMSIVAELIVGRSYTLKMVIGDSFDTVFDSAIFLEGDSFGFQLNLGDNRTVQNGNAPCGNTIETLGLAQSEEVTYQWFELNAGTNLFEVVPDETSSTLDVHLSGTYRLEVTAPNNTVLSDEVVVEFDNVVTFGTPENIAIEDDDNDGIAIFDLTVNEATILDALDPTDFIVTYYETLEDAQAEINPIASPSSYVNIENPQTIYVVIDPLNLECSAITQFTIETTVLGIADLNEEVFSVYPNPVSDILQITNSSSLQTEIELYNLHGHKIKSIELAEAITQQINVSKLASGIYILRFINEEQTIVRRIIKN